MDVIQVRVPEGIMEEVDSLVKKGLYSNRSDVIRDALRKFALESQIGTIKNTGDSVQEIREIRKKLSKEKIDLNEINALGE
ncbi:MAG: ribbon-helix-helix protein, CopG family [Candidatus ainarchaeum sp.]|nr:ribbon-helix-helix protein, CopG family [Candidatus ainarchaeum sp.]